jgi:hypothetical protein
MVGDFPFMLRLVEAFLGVFQQHRRSSLTLMAEDGTLSLFPGAMKSRKTARIRIIGANELPKLRCKV